MKKEVLQIGTGTNCGRLRRLEVFSVLKNVQDNCFGQFEDVPVEDQVYLRYTPTDGAVPGEKDARLYGPRAVSSPPTHGVIPRPLCT